MPGMRGYHKKRNVGLLLSGIYNCMKGYQATSTFIMQLGPIRGSRMKNQKPFIQQLKRAPSYLNKRLYAS
jgi:hypothetical protein